MSTATFASRLNQAMALRHMKQVDFIHAASTRGVKLGKSHISQYVSGKTTPRPDIMRFLAATLNVSEDWLAAGNGPMERGSSSGSQPDSRRSLDLTADASPASSSSSSPSSSASSSPMPDSSSPTPASSPKGHPMRRFTKSTKLDNVLYDVRGPVVDEAARMEATGTHVLKLNIGNPAPFGFRTPDEVIYDMAHQLPECEGYSASKGLFSARKAIMQYAQLKNLPNVSIDDIYTGNGVSELINLSMSALLDNGDEVLIPSPDYPLWTACVNLAGGTAVHYLCDEQSEWYPDIDDMRSKITDKTKAIVVINPNNPTGALYPKEVLQQIVDLAREHQLMIFSDEIYDRLVMDGLQHVSIASLAPDLFCVTFSGLSKSHMIAGYRVGWMVLSGNKNVARDYIEGLNMLTNMRICSNVPAQSIVQTALGGHQSVNDYIVPGGRIYEQRDYIYNALNSIPGVTAVKPKAAFYIFPKLDVKKFNISDDEQFALDLLHDERILITRGGGFNWHEPDHFRIVYLPRIEVLKDATAKLTDFLSYYRQ
ncbi:aspartate aminotransferase [Bifidobacterium simiarum]|uniref:alanine transaminase n=2 Tax=Bifidobacterium simiarum TaxID=2045441 RepID=A0A2M9HD56_9BIFI|nr:aminotransferase class I/II-fold pyridoxal phosphate-dependent enzyme [Bifidobacterium simiarum]PJM74732.1 aspartate aminotransferase [Bifidobacterium simiarum]